ncbi:MULTISPECIES: MlaE family ABC transporter permease [Commensalibacter]|uniref:ABC ABC transporter permease n=2 Tax=Commensalibacter TaxID=1079922 RepID=W7E606_9PROT|nr:MULTISPECIES: ABC transporter permease [Commensalibacter]EUK18531.1 ABC ABC transporter permease [Commensalibacter papalotli (ex Servin-Garciduenas et al. 2014)]CAI3932185.1 Permease subunit MlaE of the ABC-type intermembrane phospholipid transporter Mla (MlaE) (PDB:6IC4) [Commensalibacter papalotli (ex Botero et al. 2024)]CAI3943500.1 Permease subunit MlaE of the ABC-type intermembrane phospholipid transporter Mla (MlaE) (PDB:6IC4) [Commensalibacter papalotli (ex Botero et al. 2024)]
MKHLNGFEQKSFEKQDDKNRIETMLADLNKDGIDDVEQYVKNIRNRESQETQRLSFRLKMVEEGRFAWLQKIAIIILWYLLPILYVVGEKTRSYFRFLLGVLAASWGILVESASPITWRRTVKYEFKRSLGQVVCGGFFSTFFTATLAGLAVVSQAIFWLGAAGLTKMTGPILITVLVREVAPILVGMILLGRNGILTVTECSLLAMGGQLKSLTTMGIDPFITIVLPRAWAFTIGSFTLGMIFGTTSLFMGYVVTYALGTMQDSIWTFYSNILSAMSVADYVLVPLKFVVMGFMVGVGSCITGMNVKVDDEPSTLLPKGFTRGIMLIMVVNILFTLDF